MFGITSFTKNSGSAENILTWVKKRLTSALVTARLPKVLDTQVPNIQYDIKALGNFLENKPEFKVALFREFLIQNIEIIEPFKAAFNCHKKMILSYHGLTSAKCAYDFAVATETEAHYILQIVQQSKMFIKNWESVKNSVGDLMPYHYTLNGSRPILNLRNIADLAYCARMRKAADSTSWKNMVRSEAFSMSIPYDSLNLAIQKPLSAGEIGHLHEEVQEYLKLREKKIPQAEESMEAVTALLAGSRGVVGILDHFKVTVLPGGIGAES